MVEAVDELGSGKVSRLGSCRSRRQHVNGNSKNLNLNILSF